MEEDGERRKAFADDLTQPQIDFLFHAKEQRKKLRREGSGGSSPSGGKITKNTTHIT